MTREQLQRRIRQSWEGTRADMERCLADVEEWMEAHPDDFTIASEAESVVMSLSALDITEGKSRPA